MIVNLLYKKSLVLHTKFMKNFKIVALTLLIMFTIALAGCGEKELPAAKITRDEARTGGALSFVYDQNERLITIGGEGEIVQFSSARETKNLDEGTRIGIRVTAPDENLNVENATLKMNGVKYSSGDFLAVVNGQKQRYFEIQPLVSEVDKKVAFTICWDEGTKEQTYQIVIAKGTRFMNKNGELEEIEKETK